MIDTGYMRKVLVNLVSNAIKFTPDSGRIDIFVASVRGKNGERLFYMNVCDTGHGLVAEDLKRFSTAFTSLRRVPNIRFTGRAVQASVFSCASGLYICMAEKSLPAIITGRGFIPYVDAADSRRTGRDEWGVGTA